MWKILWKILHSKTKFEDSHQECSWKQKEITNVTLTRMLLMGRWKTLSAIHAAKPLSRNNQVMMVHIIVTTKWMITFANYVNNFVEGGENQDSSSCAKSFI